MKRCILVELDSNETPTSSFYLDVFGCARDQDTLNRVGRWAEVTYKIADGEQA